MIPDPSICVKCEQPVRISVVPSWEGEECGDDMYTALAADPMNPDVVFAHCERLCMTYPFRKSEPCPFELEHMMSQDKMIALLAERHNTTESFVHEYSRFATTLRCTGTRRDGENCRSFTLTIDSDYAPAITDVIADPSMMRCHHHKI